MCRELTEVSGIRLNSRAKSLLNNAFPKNMWKIILTRGVFGGYDILHRYRTTLQL